MVCREIRELTNVPLHEPVNEPGIIHLNYISQTKVITHHPDKRAISTPEPINRPLRTLVARVQ